MRGSKYFPQLTMSFLPYFMNNLQTLPNFLIFKLSWMGNCPRPVRQWAEIDRVR